MPSQYKISNLLKEFTHDKNKWINLNSSQLSDIQDELFDIIDNTYKPLGGHPDLKSKSDINMSDLELWLSIDVDDDPEIEASHKIAEVLEVRSVPVVMDKKTIERVINKPIKYLSNGWYIRDIGGQPIKKRLFGRPN